MALLKISSIDTPLGEMLLIADEKALYFLEFSDWKGLDRAMGRLSKQIGAEILPGKTKVSQMAEDELKRYFAGKLSGFKTPLALVGTPFQVRVWQKLKEIPKGETCSYAALAKAIKRPTAYRAVANANGSNLIAIMIPCHRVINSNGQLGGYGGSVPRKKWLLDHEKKLSR